MTERSRPSSQELAEAKSTLFSEEKLVRFQDVDAAGIIFFARVFDYFHDTFVNMLPTLGLDMPNLVKGSYKLPLVHAEADYLGPMRFGDRVVVDVVKADLSDRSIRVGYRIRSLEGRPLAIGHLVHVCVDSSTFRSMVLPDELQAAFKRAEEQATKEA